MVRLGVTLVAVLLFLGAAPMALHRSFEDEAALAVWAWRTSGAAERWRDGFVPLGELSAIPPGPAGAVAVGRR